MSYSFHNSYLPESENFSQEVLHDLAHKSQNLYVFWENYQRLYNEHLNLQKQNEGLKDKIGQLEKIVQNSNKKDNERVKQLVKEKEKMQGKIKMLRKENEQKEQNYMTIKQQKVGLQNFVKQLKLENQKQQESIQKIIQKLKKTQETEGDHNQKTQNYKYQINVLTTREKQLKEWMNEKDSEIQKMELLNKKTKQKCEQIIKEYLLKAKEKMEESIHFALQHSMIHH